MDDRYDLIITGGGPAATTAALCASRLGLKTAVVERMMIGNQIMNCERIENVPGFPEGVGGADFAALLFEQAMTAGAEIITAEVSQLAVEGDDRVVVADGREMRASAVILAHGSSLRELGIPGESEFRGSGVSHCATCDGPLFSDQIVGVVGGGDSAVDEALTLTNYARDVILFHRGAELSAQAALRERLLQNSKANVRLNTVVEEVVGNGTVSGVRVRDNVSGTQQVVDLTGLFVFVGLDPNTAFLRGIVDLDPAGHVVTDIGMQTSVPGVFAAGDIRQGSVALIASVAGDGATAAVNAHRYVRNQSRAMVAR